MYISVKIDSLYGSWFFLPKGYSFASYRLGMNAEVMDLLWNVQMISIYQSKQQCYRLILFIKRGLGKLGILVLMAISYDV